ncbi:MAG TPA: DUF4369 domain-containing protein, partial [Puia sp.]|nr:DUF4369 domain-containing protein [Puia sp.]
MTPEIFSQTAHSNNQFVIDGEIIGRDTGTIVLWYDDSRNKGVADTFKLNMGKFHLTGTVNRVCEAILWTNVKNHDFDDPSVVHFLLEPNTISISYKINN